MHAADAKDLIFFLLEKLHQKLNKISNEAISKVELVSTACVFEVKSNPVVQVVLVVVCGNEDKSKRWSCINRIKNKKFEFEYF